ncbi:decorin-like isoform X2 [Octopus bimaculoides]|uniref:decorin-like isoform X2 n=1 Tax=Octopus bimaculoides TaxID=37653 RepID=UPI0022E6010B|nr:decorin-like isoform X2 [Octopus bimaculoides]
MFRQNFHVMLTFVLLLYLRLFLEAHAVSDVCKLCECKSQRVSCEYLDLSSVPQNISGTVEYFYLSNNKITKIEDESFRNLLSLESLQLDNNEISNIEKESLKHLSNLEQLYLQNNTISNIEHGTFQGLNSLQILRLCNNSISKIEKETFVNLPELYEIRLSDNKISKIEKESFVNLPKLKEIDLSSNAISSLKQHTFKKLTGLKTLDLSNNKMSSITQETFQNLYSLEDLNLSRNQIQMIEDGAFLFLPNIKKINLIGNKNLKCGYHLPAVVNYMTSTYNRTVDVLGKCLRGLDNEEDEPISIMNHTQSKYYSLFQKNLQCQTCSGMMCNDSEVTNCTGAELVCQYKLSMSGVTLKFERFCSTYRNCLEAMRNNTSTCNEWANGTSCVACCSGNQCNKNDFMDWNNTFEYHLIYTIDRHPISKNCNEYKNHFENVSRAVVPKHRDIYYLPYSPYYK